jgi:Spy/CpxP family protein refolding chaperone
MNELKKMFLGLTASTLVLSSFTFAPLAARAQAEVSEGPMDEVVLVTEEGGPPMDVHESWAEKMGLSDEQMEKLISLKSDYAVKTAEQKAQLMADWKKMMMLMTASEVDKSAIQSLHEKMDSIKSDLSSAHLHHMMDVMEVMTSKQRSTMRHEMLVHMSDPHHMKREQHWKMHHHN